MSKKLYGAKHEEQEQLDDHGYFFRRVKKAAQVCRRFRGGVPFQDKVTVDVGCGYGALSLHAINEGAKKVLAIDPDAKSVATAMETIRAHSEKHEKQISFITGTVDQLEPQTIDLAVSMAVFEHIPDPESELKFLYRAMKPNGLVYLAIGPLYRAPWGDHGRMKAPLHSVLPWAHLCFPRKWLLERLNRNQNKQVRYQKLPDLGLNGCTLNDYIQAFNRSGFTIEWMKTNVYEKPIVSGLLNTLCRVPFLRDLFCVNIYVILKRTG